MHEGRHEAVVRSSTWSLVAAASGLGLGISAAMSLRKPQRKQAIRGRVVLITGGSRGLGLALAREFGRLGGRIAICARTEDQLLEARTSLRREGVECFAMPCDVSVSTQVDELIHNVERDLGPIDILVANAGEILVAPLENTTVDDFQRAMAVMFWGILHPAMAVLPGMKARGRGNIAVITSIGGKVSVPHLTAYCCAKAAAVAFCEGLRAEVAKDGVQVTTIAPGLMRTGSHVNAQFKGQFEKEAGWFTLAASAPGLSMNAERAARQIVDAIRKGQSERILSVSANLLARLHGVAPGLVPDILSLIAPLLPSPTKDNVTAKPGAQLLRSGRGLLKLLMRLGQESGRRLNQATP